MLHLYNSLTRQKEPFTPIDPTHIRMYVCGPTVYDRAHIGNARAVVVYDVLFRLLRNLGREPLAVSNEAEVSPLTTHHSQLTYARNITDVDDKINARAKERGTTIQQLTHEVTQWFHDDMDALNNLRPTVEPRATQHIGDIITLIEKILANGHAYVSQGHVLFDVENFTQQSGHYHYGDLSGKKLEDLIAGARVEVESYKKNPADFVLWKPADSDDDASSVFDSPWGKGRPGWHIECSAMSEKCLGENFDIHGGGADLKFPHHENEIAQSLAAHPHSHYAKYWVHNGFVTVNGEKMSKSLGNFITVRDLLEQGWRGEEIRFVLLATQYRKPLDFNDKALEDARKVLERLYGAVTASPGGGVDGEFLAALEDDLNTPKAIARLLELAKTGPAEQVKSCAALLGLLEHPEAYVQSTSHVDTATIESLIAARAAAKLAKNWAEADRIRDEISALGVTIKDNKDGTTEWNV